MSATPKEERPTSTTAAGATPDFSPRELFRRVQKRDGAIVDFDRERITEAIWAAARSVGGTSRAMSDLLTDRVILFLARVYDDHLLTVEEVQDAVEKVLIEQGHAKTGKAYILYRERRARERTEEEASGRSTLFEESPVRVQSGRDKRVRWNRDQIVEALLRETTIPKKFALQIGREIERQIINSRMDLVTAPLIREMVNCKLIEHHLDIERMEHVRLGLRLSEVESLLGGARKEQSAYPDSPLTATTKLAERIHRQYAVQGLYPEEVCEAHLAGDLYLHHTGGTQALHHGVQSLEYLKLYGLEFPGVPYRDAPPREGRDLLECVSVFAKEIAGYFHGGVSWPFLNVFAAPFFAGLPEEEVRREIRSFFRNVARFDRSSGRRHGPICLDLCWSLPESLGTRPAIGPDGKMQNDRPYIRHLVTARSLFRLLLQEYAVGDGQGQPIQGVEVRIHLSKADWVGGCDQGPWEDIQSAVRSNVPLTFLLQRGDSIHFPECMRLSLSADGDESRDIRYPWKLRFGSWGKVSVHLPRLAARTGGREAELEEALGEVFQCALTAASAKKKQMEGLFHQGGAGPLGLLMLRKDGEPYLRKTAFLLGLYGLRQAAMVFLGDPETPEGRVRETERKIVERMYVLCRKSYRDLGIPLLLAQAWEPDAVEHFLKFEPERMPAPEPSQATQMLLFGEGVARPGRKIDPGSRVQNEGFFHDYLEGGGRVLLAAEDFPQDIHGLRGFFQRLYRDTRALAVKVESATSYCEDCGLIAKGRHELCPGCSSANVV